MMPALLRVMYAPLDYIHPAHFATPKEAIAPELQQAVNHALIRRFELATALDFKLQSGDFSQMLVQEWSRVVDAAWLLGCKMGRGSLAMNGHLATLPDVARRFIELPLDCAPVPLTGPLAGAVTHDVICAHGARYLFLLKQQLPDALGQRLNLMFAPGVAVLEMGSAPTPVLNRSLITFAFDYAKNIKH